MWLAIANSLAPVFLVIALGWLLGRHHWLTAPTIQQMVQLTYWISLPCLLFYKIASAGPVLGEAGHVLLVMLGATGTGVLAAYGLARALGVPGSAIGTFLQAAFRGNLAFVGLPVILYAFASLGRSTATAETTALVVFGPLIALYNVAGVLALLLSRPQFNGRLAGQLLRELLGNPLLLACAGGTLCAMLGWHLPVLLERTLAVLGQLALPLALLCLGGSLVVLSVGDSLRWSASAVAIKLLLLPLLGYGFARWLGVSADGTRIALILLACPTATISYVLVRQLGGDAALAAGAIVLSTVLAVLPFAVILALI
jgi:predicted permease